MPSIRSELENCKTTTQIENVLKDSTASGELQGRVYTKQGFEDSVSHADIQKMFAKTSHLPKDQVNEEFRKWEDINLPKPSTHKPGEPWEKFDKPEDSWERRERARMALSAAKGDLKVAKEDYERFKKFYGSEEAVGLKKYRDRFEQAQKAVHAAENEVKAAEAGRADYVDKVKRSDLKRDV